MDIKSAVKHVVLAACLSAAFYLLAAAIFAVVVRAYAPPAQAVTAVNWILKALACPVFSLLFIRGDRALFQGIAAGALSSLLSMLMFAAVGGGFYLTPLYPLELLLMAVTGGFGAILGVKLRKEA